MLEKLNSWYRDNQLSFKDTILGVLCAFSALLCFALSFTLLTPDGRPCLFAGSLAVFFVCLMFVEKKWAITGGAAIFILLRLIWAAMLTADQHWRL